MLRPMKLLKVGICDCGWRVIADGIEVGTLYDVDLEEGARLAMRCGGCLALIPVDCVYVGSRGSSEGGMLPRELFAGD